MVRSCSCHYRKETLHCDYLAVVGATSLTPSTASACPGEVVSLTCSSDDGTAIGHRWTVSVPGYDPVHQDILNTGSPSVSLTPAADSGVEFLITRVIPFPLVSSLTTTTALDGTVVVCSGGSGVSSPVTIHITGTYYNSMLYVS